MVAEGSISESSRFGLLNKLRTLERKRPACCASTNRWSARRNKGITLIDINSFERATTLFSTGPKVTFKESAGSGNRVALYIRIGGAPGNDKSFTVAQPPRDASSLPQLGKCKFRSISP